MFELTVYESCWSIIHKGRGPMENQWWINLTQVCWNPRTKWPCWLTTVTIVSMTFILLKIHIRLCPKIWEFWFYILPKNSFAAQTILVLFYVFEIGAPSIFRSGALIKENVIWYEKTADHVCVCYNPTKGGLFSESLHLFCARTKLPCCSRTETWRQVQVALNNWHHTLL